MGGGQETGNQFGVALISVQLHATILMLAYILHDLHGSSVTAKQASTFKQSSTSSYFISS